MRSAGSRGRRDSVTPARGSLGKSDRRPSFLVAGCAYWRMTRSRVHAMHRSRFGGQ